MADERQIDRLLGIMARLRDPEGGCPWDLEQDFATIAPYTVEEAYEVADAIERRDWDELRDELGDLLLQVVFHARMAEERGLFAFDDVARSISDKMVRRHPHVFHAPDADKDAEAVSVTWEDIKRAERAEKRADRPAGLLDDVALALPALMRAEKLSKRAARAGFEWPDLAAVFAKLDEEIGELKSEIAAGADTARLKDELGDVLFTLVNVARWLKLDPEDALRHGNAKFTRRFRAMEARAHADGATLEAWDMARLEAAWRAAKAAE